MKRRMLVSVLGVAAVFLGAGPARSHFQVLKPSADSVSFEGDRTVELAMVFTHPMADGPVMSMRPPKAFGVLLDGKKTDLLASVTARKVDGKDAYSASYKIARPGDHVFYLEPGPYWEPAEGKMIIHYTKVVVDGMGGGEGWDRLVGLPVEIEPLTRPYGLWTGNLFRGIVRQGGKPLPFAEVEVEYLNEGGKVTVPAESLLTQVIKADANGVFAYAMPKAGWWAFAALIDGEKSSNPDGKMVDTELGAVIWVKTVDMK